MPIMLPPIDRRNVLLGGGALLGAGAMTTLAAAPALAQTGGVIAPTTNGAVRGRVVDGMRVFEGIRYGATTAGRRFMPPLPPRKWPGVMDALDFGNESPQGTSAPDSWSSLRPQSEDCLFLNVYTPGTGDDRKRPVMVWFHGGGWFSGSAGRRYSDGTRLARRGDVVVVGVNHRLNAFGYLWLGHLLPALADSGNAGNLDMLLSLQWVRDNIAAFGGDPGNVTIFGQSGGGGKVTTLMGMSSAKGLFHKAIVQSGSFMRSAERPQAEASTAKLLANMGLTPAEAGKLQTMPMEQFRAGTLKPGVQYRPVVDGRSVPYHPFDPGAPEVSRGVPLLVGTCQDETTRLYGSGDPSLFTLSWDDLPARLGCALPGMDVGAVIAELRRIEPFARPSDIYFTATTEAVLRRSARLQAERKAAAGGAPAFMYLLSWQSPADGGKWKAPHSLDNAFVFDNVAVSSTYLGRDPEANPETARMAEAMSSAWIAFARTGNPGWAPYTPDNRATMVFDVPARVEIDPRAAVRRLFDASGYSL